MKKIWFAIGAAVIVALLLLQTRFKTYMQVDYNGYAIEDKTVRTMLLADPDAENRVESADLYSFNVLDYIYSRGNSYYMGEGKKTKVDLSFPLLINGGAGVWFLDDTATLFNTEYERFSTYSGLTVSEKVSYNPGGERAADDEYYFAGLKNGFFINLGSFSISQGTEKHIPMNSMIYFTENYFAYCEIDDDSVNCKVIDNIRPDAPVTVGDEELTYKQLLINLRVLYDTPEKNIKEDEIIDEPPVIPSIEVNDEPITDEIENDDLNEDKEEREQKVREPRAPRQQSGGGGGGGAAKRGGAGTSGAQDQRGVRPDSMRPDKNREEEELTPVEGYVKPTVTILDTQAKVYRVLIDVKVDDPANRLDKLRKVQFEFYEQLPNGKETLSYRTYTGTSGTVTAGNGGIKPDTTYRVNAYFTYLNEYNERVVESIASDIFVTTGSISSIGSIVFKKGLENGINYMDIPYYYDRYAEIVNVTYDETSDEEAVYGIDAKSMLFTATKGTKSFSSYLDASAVASFKKGTLSIFTTAPNLEPKSDYTYEITAQDFFGNSLTLVNNTGTFKTCKSRPQGKIDLVTNEIGNTVFKVEVADPDQSSIPPQGGASNKRDVYLIASTRKIDTYTGQDSLWDAISLYNQATNERYHLGQEDEGSIHFVKKIEDGLYTVDPTTGELTVPEMTITANNLDLNTKYYVYLIADFDLDNNKGPVYHDEIADLSFKSATLSSLGNIYITVDISNITAHSANIIYTLNKDRTNDRLEQLLSDILFTINTSETEGYGIHSAINFNADAMNEFTGYERDHITPYTPVSDGKISMSLEYFDGGASLSDADKQAVTSFTDLKGNHVVTEEPAYYLQSMTNYNITPTIYAVYNGKRYEMNVSLTKSTFKTMREPAKVTVTNKLLAAGTLRFKVRIDDPDEAITGNSGHVVVMNLYDSHKRLVKAIRIPKNSDDYLSYEFTGLDPTEKFVMNFIAVEYNLGYDNTTFKSNELIHQEIVDDNVDLSGSIKLLGINNFSTGKLSADTRVLIYDNERRLNNVEHYYISVEKNGVDITSSYDTSLWDVSDYEYVAGTNTIKKTSSWIVDKGDNKYKMTLYVYIYGNKLVLDTLEFNTKDVVTEISSAEDFIKKIKANPRGRFVVTDDIDMDDVDLDSNGKPKETIPSAAIVSTFRGEIDFQGYTLKKNKYKNEDALFNNLSPQAEIYNAVFEFSDNTTTRIYDKGILTRHNYGHIHDVIVYYKGGSGLQNSVYGLLAARNAASGIIERFVIKNDPEEGTSTFTARTSAGLVVYLNDGIIRNGYVYGSDINTVTSNVSVGGAINVGGIAGYQNPRGQTSNVFSLVNVVVSNPGMNAANNHDTQYGAVIGYAAGSSKNMYSVGQSFYNVPFGGATYDADRPGPALGTNTTTQHDVYYWNAADVKYAKGTKQTKIGLESLYDYSWQGSLLGSQFDAQPVEVGFYPHVIMNEELPEQEFIELPERIINRLVEVVSTEVISYGDDGNSALVKLRLNNPRNAAIKSVEIENLTTELYEDDTYKTVMLDGYTTTYITVSNPQKYVSLYAIKSLSVLSGSSTQTVSSDALLSVDFYRLVHNADEWYDYVVMKPTENARLANDIDFSVVTDYKRIRVTSTYTGKLDGGKGLGGLEKEANATRQGYQLKNINFVSNASSYDPVLFTRVDGEISNIVISNYVAKVPNRAYNCLISSLYGEVRNVHTLNPVIEGRSYLSPLVGYAYAGAVIENCSASNATVTYKEPANTNTEGQMGGIAARADSARIVNCFVRDITIEANDLRSCIGAGAIVGYSGTSVLSNVYATGSVNVRGNYVGGLVGYHTSTNITNVMTNMISRVNVTSYQDKVGGIVGGMNMSEGPLDERNNMSGVALGNVLCVNTDSEDVSYTTGYMAGHRSVFYGSDFQLFNGITNAKFDEDGILLTIDPSLYQGTIKNWDKNTCGLITYDEAKDPSTYTSILNMDLGVYDYSKATREVLPTLYYLGTSEPMPFQPDTPISLIKIKNDLIKVTSVFVSERTLDGTIALDLEGPAGYVITDVTVQDLQISKRLNDTAPFNSSGYTRMPIDFSYGGQDRFLDSYMLTSISYKSADGSVAGTSDYSANPVRIPLTLFADINDITKWNYYISPERNYGNYENYNVTADIPFEGNVAYNTNAKIGRLRGKKTTGSGMVELSGIHTKKANENFIFRLNSEISNFKFKDCSVSTSGRDCIGLIGVSSGKASNMVFEDITINSTSANNYIGIIGYQNGGSIGAYDPADPDKDTITLKNITIGTNATTASPYAGGLVGYAKGNAMFANITADNVNVFGNGYVGGIVGGTGKANFNHIRGTDFKVRSYNNSKVGGIVGYIGAGRISSKTAAYFTDVQLKGTPTGSDFTDDSSTVISFVNGNTNSNSIGGIIGYADIYWLGRDPKGTRVNNVSPYDSNESHVSIMADGIVVKGYMTEIGGIYGFTNACIYDSHCYNSLITQLKDITTISSCVGGISGKNNYENYYNVTKNTLIRINNHSYVGLITGYQNASANMNYCKVEDSKIQLGKAGSVTGELKYVGGLTGYNYYPISFSTAYNVTIEAPEHNYVGGLTGYANNALSRCMYYATPDDPSKSPEADEKYVVRGNSYVGGIAGYHYTANISYSYSNASVIAMGNYAGGISGAYRNNYILTKISGKDNYSYSTASMYYDYFAGMVRAKNYAGGLVGEVTMTQVADTEAAANGGRRSTARGSLIRTGSNTEAAYTYRNMGLASVVMATDGTEAHAFAGNLDGFEGKANTHNAGTPYNISDDMSNVDKATMTFFWNGTVFSTTAGDTVISELKLADAPAMAQNKSTQAKSIVTSENVPARYLPYGNDVQTRSAYNGIEANAKASLNVRLVSSNDLKTHGPYYSLQWTDQTTNSTNPTWKGKYSIILSEDTKSYPEPYVYTLYGYDAHVSYLPHVRINDLGNNTAKDYLTEYQVRKGMNLPIPQEVVTRTRKLMAARPMGAPNVSAPVIYTSDVDKINVEFAEDALSSNGYYQAYLKIYYGNESEPSISLLVDRRVYTFSYDFAKKLRIDYGYVSLGEYISYMEDKGLTLGEDYELEDVLDSIFVHSETEKIEIDEAEEDEESIDSSDYSSETVNAEEEDDEKDVLVYRPNQLVRHVMTYGSAYYYITKTGVIKGYGTSSSDEAGATDESQELISGEFINLYYGRGLLKNGCVVDLIDGGSTSEPVKGIELLDYTYALESFLLNSTRVNTFYRFSTVGSGEEAIDRGSQILKSKNGNVNLIHSSVENVKDSVVMYTKDGEEYLTVLGTDGIMIDLYQGDNLNVPKDFKRGGIVYMTNNFETTAPFVLVEYQNGGIVGFNYMTGQYLFDNSVKNEMSLLDYVKVYFEDEKSKLSSAPAAYAATRQVVEFAGTPDRLQTFAAGINNGDAIEGNNTDTDIKAESDQEEKYLADDSYSAKAGDETKLRDLDNSTGFDSDKQVDLDAPKIPASVAQHDEPADGSKADGDSDANGFGTGQGSTAEAPAGVEGVGGESDNLVVSDDGGNIQKGGTSKAEGTSMGEGPNELPDPTFDGDDVNGDNLSSDDALGKGKGKGKVDATGENNPSQPKVVSSSDNSNEGSSSYINMDSQVANTATEMATNKPKYEDGTTGGVRVGRNAPSVKDSLEDDVETDLTVTEDMVLTEKRLMTVYNQATGTYEIIDMDQFLSAKDYKSENDRLAIRDFGVYGGYATAEKPKDEENRNGILLYILVSIALVGGVAGGVYYKKKHKVKI